MVASQLNASKTRKGGATKVNQKIQLVVKNVNSNYMNAAKAEEFKQFKAWCGIQGEDGYNTPWSTKVNHVELLFNNRKVKFSDEFENTQYAKNKN